MEVNNVTSLSPRLRERLSVVRHLALDMDGIIYMGGTLFPFTPKFQKDLSLRLRNPIRLSLSAVESPSWGNYHSLEDMTRKNIMTNNC